MPVNLSESPFVRGGVWVTLRVLIAAGLAVDAYVHAVTASAYDVPAGGLITQGDLFRIEAGVSGLAAVLVLFFARRTTFAFAFLVAASALGAVVLYRYVDIGSLGPLPRMYEPVWTLDKLVSAAGEAVAAVLAAAGFMWAPQARSRGRRHKDASVRTS